LTRKLQPCMSKTGLLEKHKIKIIKTAMLKALKVQYIQELKAFFHKLLKLDQTIGTKVLLTSL
jgi:hypothetical protein